MSKIAISGASTGTATFTIESPATSTNRTITIPDATTTLVGTDATQTLTNKSIVATQLTGTIAAARLPAGSVLQVVSATKTNTASTTSTSFTNVTGLTASITPSSATSKILVMASVMVSKDNSDATTIFLAFAGGNTSAYIGDSSSNRVRTISASRYTDANSNIRNLMVPVSMLYLDSPNTTSATTYSVQFRVSSGTGYVNQSGEDVDSSAFGRGASTITVMEIAA
jgi:hypothetical protein